MATARETTIGIVTMLACCFFFILNDTMVKAAGETMPLGQIILVRGLIATAAVGAYAWYVGALKNFRAQLTWPAILRTTGEVGATYMYLTALIHLPIANTSAVAASVPLMLTAFGALFLGERVTGKLWAAVVIGFGGVLLIVRPGLDGFNAFTLLVIASNFLVLLRDLSTRYVAPTASTAYLTFVTALFVTIMGAGVTLTEDLQPMTLTQILYVVAASAFVILGWMFSIITMRHGDVSVVAPFRYSFIPFAILIGWLVWGDIPDVMTLVGITIVVATGVYTFVGSGRGGIAANALPDDR